MARLYANENFPLPTVERLRELGHEVLTSVEAGKAGQAVADSEVLDFAIAGNRAVLTLNRRHFVKLHKDRPSHAGIVVCTFDPDFSALAERIDEAVKTIATVASQLIRVNRPPK